MVGGGVIVDGDGDGGEETIRVVAGVVAVVVAEVMTGASLEVVMVC